MLHRFQQTCPQKACWILAGLGFVLLLIVIESLARSWVGAQQQRLRAWDRRKTFPRPLPLRHLGRLLRSPPPSIQQIFFIAETWFQEAKIWSLELPLPGLLCFRRFVLVADDDLLQHICVRKASRYSKQHAFGILEWFRLTKLPSSGDEAWKAVHRLVSRFGTNTKALNEVLAPTLDTWIEAQFAPDSDHELADGLRNIYWKVVIILVLGHEHAEIAQEYEVAWTTCMERLNSPQAFLFWFTR